MNYEFFIARRYIFSKKSHNAINIISGISVVGVAVATMALVCTLSVFNGFHDLVASLFTAFDPQLRITLAEGSTIQANDSRLQKVKKLDCVAVYTPVMEGQAMVVLNGQQHVVTIMGVADNFSKQTHIEDILYGEGSFGLHADVLEYGVVGLQLAAKMNLNIDFTEPLQVYAPKRGERVNMANPLSSFNHQELQSPGVVFQVQQSKYDANYIITSLGFAQRLFDYQGRISSAEVKLKKGTSLSQAKKEIKALLGDTFVVQDRYEQQDDVFRIMRIEKLISYLFLTFICGFIFRTIFINNIRGNFSSFICLIFFRFFGILFNLCYNLSVALRAFFRSIMPICARLIFIFFFINTFRCIRKTLLRIIRRRLLIAFYGIKASLNSLLVKINTLKRHHHCPR